MLQEVRMARACECAARSVCFGKYWRRNLLVFSFEPRCARQHQTRASAAVEIGRGLELAQRPGQPEATLARIASTNTPAPAPSVIRNRFQDAHAHANKAPPAAKVATIDQ